MAGGESGWRPGRLLGQWAPLAGMVLLGAFLAWVSDRHPGSMPVWAPWEFSPFEYLALTWPTLWFFQGLSRTAPAARPPVWRRCLFLFGIGLIYLVLQTRYDYWAQHLFVLNRIQHVVMHHFGPFLIVVAGVGERALRGAPSWVRRVVDSRGTTAVMRVLQQPVLAGVLFVGSFFVWLIPPIHFGCSFSVTTPVRHPRSP